MLTACYLPVNSSRQGTGTPKGKKKVEKENTISLVSEKVTGAPATSSAAAPKKSKIVTPKKSATAKSKARDAQDVTVRRQGKD